MQRQSTCQHCGKIIESQIGPVPKLCAVCRIDAERERGKSRRKKTYAERNFQAKTCVDCGEPHYRINSPRCFECAVRNRKERQNEMRTRRRAARHAVEHGEAPPLYDNHNPCGQCAFLTECRNIVDNSVRKDGELVSPYCFIDSIYHHRYLAQYGQTPAGKARKALQVAA